MKEKRVWIGLATLFAVIGVPQLFWKPSRFGGVFLLALAIGCMGEWLMLCGREKHKACRILSRVGRVLFALFVLSFAAVQVLVIGIAFDEDDPSAAPQADYYLVLGALVNPNGQPSAALAARCDTAVRQFELAAEAKGERVAVLEARRHYCWYLKGVPHSGYYKEQIVQMNTLEDVYRVTRGIKRDLV